MSLTEPNCFGFFGGSRHGNCSQCLANKRCKAILVTHGFDMMSTFIETLLGDLDDTDLFLDSNRVSDLATQLKEPPKFGQNQDILEMMNEADLREASL